MQIIEQSELDGMPCPDTLIHGECLESMKHIADGSIDAIICDLPYGTTACKWDSVIPFAPLWEAYKRVIKPGGAIVLFGSEPFSSHLRLSNIKWFRYDWIWDKAIGSGHLLCKKMPMKRHEIVSVFYQKLPTYNSQKYLKKPGSIRTGKGFTKLGVDIKPGVWGALKNTTAERSGYAYANSIIAISKGSGQQTKHNIHPTQKPVALIEYLVNTYTNPGDLILDNTAGSMTTPVACLNTGRRFIGIELDDTYFAAGCARVRARQLELASTLDL